jgi:hypothetical protein
MAKRRNAKKEKAARNKINARKFCKPSSRYDKRGKRWFNNNNNESAETKPLETESNKSGSSESKSTQE